MVTGQERGANSGSSNDRSFSLSIYLVAFVLSLAIFAIGIYVGYLADASNLSSVYAEVSSISEKVTSAQLILLTDNNQSFCPLYLSELNDIDGEVEKVGHKLSYLEDEKNMFDSELKKKYFLLETESYLLTKKFDTVCGNGPGVIINFYSNKNCGQICKEQGIEVLKARDALKAQGVDVKLFSFDGEIGSPAADSMKSQFGVTIYPTLIVNDTTYAGYKNSEEIQQLVKQAQAITSQNMIDR